MCIRRLFSFLVLIGILSTAVLIAPQSDMPTAAAAAAYNTYLPFISNPAFYVATNGNDHSGLGTEAQPWATIGHAVTQVPAGATILVKPGTYSGQIDLDPKFTTAVTVRSLIPYQARLMHNDTVITCHRCRGITIEGFEISHSGPGADRYVIQIQDAARQGQAGRDVILRNNIIHDSYNNDLVKVNNGASHILIENNLFYNQTGLDSHVDVNSATNVIIQDNLFFNDFSGSGRSPLETGSFIVIKDSNGTDDANLGSDNIIVRRNVLFNWIGNIHDAFIAVGEDSVDYYQARNVLIENNLMLGNSSDPMRSPFNGKGVEDIVFRHNTVVGDLPSKAFAMFLELQSNNPINRNIRFYNNIWSDPTGTMGAEAPGDANDFSDTRPEETDSFTLLNNLYWNGGKPIPTNPDELINYTADSQRLVANPLLPSHDNMVLPRWDKTNGRFADGSNTIREAFLRLVQQYGIPSAGSPVIDAADASQSPTEDIFGNPRTQPDIGAVEQPNN